MPDNQHAWVRTLALGTGTISGVLVAQALQIVLSRTNLHISAAWHDLFSAQAAQLRLAVAWWLIAATALISGFVASAIARYLMLNFWPLRRTRWIAGSGLVAALAVVGGIANEPAGLDPGTYVAANLAGMTVALVTAGLGAFFAARR
jgi:hypothetical protein